MPAQIDASGPERRPLRGDVDRTYCAEKQFVPTCSLLGKLRR